MKRLLPTLSPHLPVALMVFCTGYVAMLLTNNLVWPRSLFFALMTATALLCAVTRPAETLTRLRAGGGVLLVMLLWMLWSTASLLWTVEPRFSLREWETEIQYGAFVFLSVFLAVRDTRDFRSLLTGILVAFALLAVGAIVLTLANGAFDPTRWHHDVGVWSTHLVLVAPLLLFVLGMPATPRGRRVGTAVFAVLLLLLLVNARLTTNRIVWLAFATVYGLALVIATLRWRNATGRLRWRYVGPAVVLFVVLAIAFANVLQDKAQMYYPSSMTVSQVLENDPRIELWKAVVDKIRAEPWFGYGFGRGILRAQLPVELHNGALTHTHNTLVGQWLETGCVGLALFVAMLAALAGRYVRDVRSQDRLRALVGIVGIALIAGFVVKNLTDDFFFRSNAKLFWAINGMLLATGIARTRAAAAATPVPIAAQSPRRVDVQAAA